MQTTSAVVGVDVSKATLAVCHQPGPSPQHLDVPNTPAGFRELVRRCGVRSLYVLEATGTYYLALAYHLVAAGAEVAVLNPIVVRRFIQMHLGKGKSDRKDAQWLWRFGQQQATPRWQPEEAALVECRQLQQAAELLIRQQTMVSNALEALLHQPLVCAEARRQLQLTRRRLDEQVQRIEAELLTRIEQRYAAEMPLLCSIPGIGRKTAALLLLFAGGFTRLNNHRQLIAKAGLCPHEYTSGTSVRGQTRITKTGGNLVRSKLYLCSWSACRANAACKALYQRLVAKGKHKKLALIAVCNKLLKQAFAIVKSGVAYQPDFAQKALHMT
ncbi:IS110 family transposase [Hymenobacter edaphi]|nr:IS110 family transposase [Hymenobacter edaphi]